MKLPLLLVLLFGAVSAFHLRTETSNFESPLGDESLPQDGETPEHAAMEAPMERLTLLEEEEEGGSGSEDAPEEEGAVQSISALDEVGKDFQCPKEEDTVNLVGIPGCKTCRFTVVTTPMPFNQAQCTCQRCYRGNLVSIHNILTNGHISSQCIFRAFNQGQVWIGGAVTGVHHCRRFYWVDGSAWNFWFWAIGQPSICSGHCVSMYNLGGAWRLSHCNTLLPFVCSY